MNTILRTIVCPIPGDTCQQLAQKLRASGFVVEPWRHVARVTLRGLDVTPRRRFVWVRGDAQEIERLNSWEEAYVEGKGT